MQECWLGQRSQVPAQTSYQSPYSSWIGRATITQICSCSAVALSYGSSTGMAASSRSKPLRTTLLKKDRPLETPEAFLGESDCPGVKRQLSGVFCPFGEA